LVKCVGSVTQRTVLLVLQVLGHDVAIEPLGTIVKSLLETSDRKGERKRKREPE
jgi:hypothetical protein